MMILTQVRTTARLTEEKALLLWANARNPNPSMNIIQVEVSGTEDAGGGGVKIGSGSETGTGSSTGTTGLEGGRSGGVEEESTGAIGESVGTVGESMDAPGQLIRPAKLPQ